MPSSNLFQPPVLSRSEIYTDQHAAGSNSQHRNLFGSRAKSVMARDDVFIISTANRLARLMSPGDAGGRD